MAQALIARLRDLAERPDGIGVEFGLKMSMDAGLVVAHTSGEANFKVSLQWNRA
jgi:Trypsin-co-occurring domain 1